MAEKEGPIKQSGPGLTPPKAPTAPSVPSFGPGAAVGPNSHNRGKEC